MGDAYLAAFLFSALACTPLAITMLVRRQRERRQRLRERKRSRIRNQLKEIVPAWRSAQLFFSPNRWKIDCVVDPVVIQGTFHDRCFARGRYLLPDGPVFSIGPESFFDSVAKEHGTVDLKLGARAFDDHFMVRTDTPLQTPLLWSLRAQDLMFEHFSDASIVSDGTTVTLERRGKPALELIQKCNEMRALAIELLSADLFGGEALQTLAGLSDAAKRPTVVELSVSGGAVFVGAKMRGKRAVTCVWCERSASLKLTVARQRLAPETRELVDDLSEASLETSEQATRLWFAAIVTDVSRLQAAVELMSTLTTTEVGPYR